MSHQLNEYVIDKQLNESTVSAFITLNLHNGSAKMLE